MPAKLATQKPASKASPATSSKTSAKIPPAKSVGAPVKSNAAAPAKGGTTKVASKAPAMVETQATAKAPPPVTVTLKHLAVGFAEQHDLAGKHAETLLVSFFSQRVDHLKSGERVRIGTY